MADDFVIIKPNTRGIDRIVGDIHSKFAQLQALMEDMRTDDRVVLVGDLFDRGSTPGDEVVEFIEAMNRHHEEEKKAEKEGIPPKQGKGSPEILSVMGNHELLFLLYIAHAFDADYEKRFKERFCIDPSQPLPPYCNREKTAYNGGQWYLDLIDTITDSADQGKADEAERKIKKVFDYCLKLPLVIHVEGRYTVAHSQLPCSLPELMDTDKQQLYPLTSQLSLILEDRTPPSKLPDLPATGLVFVGHNPCDDLVVKKTGYCRVNLDMMTPSGEKARSAYPTALLAVDVLPDPDLTFIPYANLKLAIVGPKQDGKPTVITGDRPKFPEALAAAMKKPGAVSGDRIRLVGGIPLIPKQERPMPAEGKEAAEAQQDAKPPAIDYQKDAQRYIQANKQSLVSLLNKFIADARSKYATYQQHLGNTKGTKSDAVATAVKILDEIEELTYFDLWRTQPDTPENIQKINSCLVELKLLINSLLTSKVKTTLSIPRHPTFDKVFRHIGYKTHGAELYQAIYDLYKKHGSSDAGLPDNGSLQYVLQKFIRNTTIPPEKSDQLSQAPESLSAV